MGHILSSKLLKHFKLYQVVLEKVGEKKGVAGVSCLKYDVSEVEGAVRRIDVEKVWCAIDHMVRIASYDQDDVWGETG